MTDVEKPVLSGWCSPAGLDGTPHAHDHASCQERLDDGRLIRCDCPDHKNGEPCPASDR